FEGAECPAALQDQHCLHCCPVQREMQVGQFCLARRDIAAIGDQRASCPRFNEGLLEKEGPTQLFLVEVANRKGFFLGRSPEDAFVRLLSRTHHIEGQVEYVRKEV